MGLQEARRSATLSARRLNPAYYSHCSNGDAPLKKCINHGARELHNCLIKGFREQQIGDYETMNLPSIEGAKEMAEDAEEFLEATRAYLIKSGYRI